MDTGLGVKGLIQRGETVLVLVKPDGKLDLPGGRVEMDESIIQALHREITEETELVASIREPLNQWSLLKPEGFKITGITYICKYGSGDVRLSSEHITYFWHPIIHLNDCSLHRFVGR